MPDFHAPDLGQAVHVLPGQGATTLVVCEHASNVVPHALDGLGLASDTLESHITWDPGALPLARGLADALSAPLVYGGISRLVYDCNRPPEAPSAIPDRSEVFDIPGNARLTMAERQARADAVYHPFRRRLAQEIAAHRATLRLLITVHSFTPVFHGALRRTEIGVLHGRDTRFALAMMASTPDPSPYAIELNAPYSAADGVAHTLDEHGAANDLPSVMLEIRNDLIRTRDQQAEIVDFLASWIAATIRRFEHADVT